MNLSIHTVFPDPWCPLFQWSYPNPIGDTQSQNQTSHLLNQRIPTPLSSIPLCVIPSTILTPAILQPSDLQSVNCTTFSFSFTFTCSWSPPYPNSYSVSYTLNFLSSFSLWRSRLAQIDSYWVFWLQNTRKTHRWTQLDRCTHTMSDIKIRNLKWVPNTA